MTTAAKTATNRMETDVAIVATVTTEATPRTQTRQHIVPPVRIPRTPRFALHKVIGTATSLTFI